MYGHTWEEQASKYHITFMIANDAYKGNYATTDRFCEATMATGYRFKVKSCETDGTITRLTVTNEGIAPLYRDAFFAIGNVRSETSLKWLLPNEELVVEINVPLLNGDDLSIVSDNILNGQEIEFEAEISGTGGDTFIGGITVSNPTASGDENAPLYNINGQKVSKDYHGIIIQNGKKRIN
jgi:hypothetical protein